MEPLRGEYRTLVERHPFSVPLSEKIDLCLCAEEVLKHSAAERGPTAQLLHSETGSD